MSIVTSIIGGIQGASAAKNAAKAQQAGADQAIKTVGDAVTAGNTQIGNAATTGQAGVTAAGTDASGRVLTAADLAGTNVVSTANTGAQAVTDAAGAAGKTITDTAATGATNALSAADLANARLDPYAKSGADATSTLDAGLADGGQFATKFGASNIPTDDGYAFREQQGELAQQRAAAARGTVSGGGFAKALEDYAQGNASQEYQNAFNRFTTERAARVGALQDLAHTGLTASTTQGANTIGATEYGGTLNTGAAENAGGLNVDASKFAGTLRSAASEYQGNTGIDSARYAGDTGVKTAEYNSDLGFKSAATQADNSNNAAQYEGNAETYKGNAQAQGMIGSANAWNGMLSGIGGAVDSAVAGGFGGGGGFSLSGALKGMAPKAPTISFGRGY